MQEMQGLGDNKKMNPLKHFGIKSKFIRSDTKSYNKRDPDDKSFNTPFNHCEDCDEILPLGPETIRAHKGHKLYNYTADGKKVKL